MAFYISRFKDIEKHEFEIELVTPLFLGGADPKKAELRAASIKGALRFWWRALYGCDDLEDMKTREAEIFGSTEKRTSFSVHLEGSENIKAIKKNLDKGKTFIVKEHPVGIIDYLAFGLRDFRQGYTREHIEPGEHFKIKFSFYDKNRSEEVLKSFYSIVRFGGLGAKTRNGFGSVAIKDLTTEEINRQNKTMPFSSFSKETRLFDKFKEHSNWKDALSEIGITYREARLSLESKHKYDKRLLIAKPIVQAGNNDRHAKPYFLHVNKLQNGKYQGQILFMPYNYYDKSKRKEYFAACNKINDTIKVKMAGGTK